MVWILHYLLDSSPETVSQGQVLPKKRGRKVLCWPLKYISFVKYWWFNYYTKPFKLIINYFLVPGEFSSSFINIIMFLSFDNFFHPLYWPSCIAHHMTCKSLPTNNGLLWWIKYHLNVFASNNTCLLIWGVTDVFHRSIFALSL